MPRPPRSRAPVEYHYHRAYKACVPCRQRKVKCELDLGRHDQSCKRCKNQKIHCHFTTQKPWSRKSEGSPKRRSELPTGARTQDIHDKNQIQRRQHHAGESKNGISTRVLQKNVTSGKDALDILFDAAAQEKEIPTSSTATARDTTPGTSSTHGESIFYDVPEIDVMRIWKGCRFVKGGWFTASEAVLLMDLFFQNMAPASPILTDFFASHRTHYWLLTQEPVLCCTILMISSRYHTLPGPTSASRGMFIHNRLWQHCQHLILRIMLGQEKLSKAKTRHLSTIEALLLLSEWYPRSLHFPPEADGWDSDLMYTVPNQRDPPPPTDETPMQDRWNEDVVEPTRRSDRMSWMLVSSALALAHELGVFHPREHPGVYDGGAAGPDVQNYLHQLNLRRRRLPSLLFVISNLLSSRIGCTSLMPYNCEPQGLDDLLHTDPHWTNLMRSWVDLTRLTQNIREALFTKPKCGYWQPGDFESLELWRAQMAAWKEKHQRIGNTHYDDLLRIEYEYLRVFANSLGVQAISERVLSVAETKETIDAAFVSRARQIKTSRNEYDYIEEVVDGTCAILARIISLSHDRSLRYLPIRVFLRIVSSSIFLLKALALGVRTAKVQESLHLLDHTIIALQADPLDDIHLVSRYAALLKIQVSRLRQSFASPGQQNNESTTHMASATDGMNQPACEEQDACATDSTDWYSQVSQAENWLSVPLDPLVGSFGSWDDGINMLEPDWGQLDLDFMWNLPP